MRLGAIGGIFGVNGQAHTEEEPAEVVPGLVELEVAVPRLSPAVR